MASEKLSVEKLVSNAFDKYVEMYKSRLEVFEPWAEKCNDSGVRTEYRYSLHECNQVEGFQSAYKLACKDVITWLEYPIRYLDGDEELTIHIDGLIVDHENEAVIFIEAKRLTKIQGVKSLTNDLLRAFKKWDVQDLSRRLKKKDIAGYKFYCLLLGDFWKSHNTIGRTYKLDESKDNVVDWAKLVKDFFEEEHGSEHRGATLKAVYNDDYHLGYALFE